MKSTSQIGQDVYVLKQLQNLRGGFFVDIGAGHPEQINNTHLLEKSYGWSGISLDLGYADEWEEQRDTPLIVGDARKARFKTLFKKHNVPKVVDYLSMDLEPPTVTLEVLKRIPFDVYTFRVITYEHDGYRNLGTVEPSRKLLEKHGYILDKTVNNQEDWYINTNL